MGHKIVNHPGTRDFHDRRTAAFAPQQNVRACFCPYGPKNFRGYAEMRDWIMDNHPLFWRHLIVKYAKVEDIAHSVYNTIRRNCKTNKPGWGDQ